MNTEQNFQNNTEANNEDNTLLPVVNKILVQDLINEGFRFGKVFVRRLTKGQRFLIG
jgi:hypothetical protein